jgi:hypothetical protein
MRNDVDAGLGSRRRSMLKTLMKPLDDGFQGLARGAIGEQPGLETVGALQAAPESDRLCTGHPETMDEDEDRTDGERHGFDR